MSLSALETQLGGLGGSPAWLEEIDGEVGRFTRVLKTSLVEEHQMKEKEPKPGKKDSRRLEIQHIY